MERMHCNVVFFTLLLHARRKEKGKECMTLIIQIACDRKEKHLDTKKHDFVAMWVNSSAYLLPLRKKIPKRKERHSLAS